jgi:hypothetical protein
MGQPSFSITPLFLQILRLYNKYCIVEEFGDKMILPRP